MPSVSPQPVVAGLTRAAIFLVLTVNAGSECDSAVRALCADLADASEWLYDGSANDVDLPPDLVRNLETTGHAFRELD
jgi:hypothetical protein